MRLGELQVGRNFRLAASPGRTFKKIDPVEDKYGSTWVAVDAAGQPSDLPAETEVDPTEDGI